MHRLPPLAFDPSAVLSASPDGLRRRTDVTAVQLWRLPDGGASC